MRLVVLAVAFVALAASAWAGPAERNSSVRLLECDPADRTASFQGEMKAFKRAVGLSMRFTLQTRDLADPGWRRVDAPGFGESVRAKAGSPGYIFDKAVQNLAPGADYRVTVRFRWRDSAGAVAAKAVARSRACRVPDTRADLVPEMLTAEPAGTDSMRIYTLRVLNTGQTEAPEFFVRLETGDGLLVEDSTDAPLAPDGSVDLRFEAPACQEGSQLTATVDTEAEVDEASESDNVLSVACPSAPSARRPGRA